MGLEAADNDSEHSTKATAYHSDTSIWTPFSFRPFKGRAVVDVPLANLDLASPIFK